MLERARGCLELHGLRLLRLRSRPVPSQRLNYAFWSHGAGEIELPAWWTDLLSKTAQEEQAKETSAVETAREYLRAGFSGGCFLDFLYPAKARSLISHVAASDVAASPRSRRQPLTSGRRAYAKRAGGFGQSRKEMKALKRDQLVQSLLKEDESDEMQLDRDRDLDPQQEFVDEDLTEEFDNDILFGDQTTTAAADSAVEPAGAHLDNSQDGVDPTDQSIEANLHRLYHKFHKYRRRRSEHEKVMSTVQLLDEKLDNSLSRLEALSTAQNVVKAGRDLLVFTEQLVLGYLYDTKGIDQWHRRDWDTALSIHLRRDDIQDERFGKVFDKLLADGRANTFLPMIVQQLIKVKDEERRRFKNAHGLYDRYTAWRASAPPDVRGGTKSFWEYAQFHNPPVNLFRLYLFFKLLVQKQPTARANNGGPSKIVRAENLIALAEMVLDQPKFSSLKGYAVLDFFTWLVQSVKDGPPSYDSMHRLLAKILFKEMTGNKQVYASLNAYYLFEAMKSHGGYRGDRHAGGPDLGRKLFYQLTKANLTPEAEEVLQDLQNRNMDQVQDYERMRWQHTRSGDSKGFERQESARVKSEQKLLQLNPQLHQIVKTSTFQIYKDRLELHRRRSEPDAMLAILDEIHNDPSLEPDTYVYNQIISGYCRTNDLENAEMFFKKMMVAGLTPDIHSYAPILQALARRGDIESVRDLTTELEAAGIEINDYVVNAHVYALLQRGNLTSAEALIWKALTFRLEDRTKMWNYVILAWALRGRRGKVNHLMDQMRRNNIPRDEFTYACRMQLWVVRKSPRRAWAILTTTMPTLGLRPVAFHYALAIYGWAQSKRDKHRVEHVYKRMLKVGIRPDWNVRVAMSFAFVQAGVLRTAKQGLTHLNTFLEETDSGQLASEPRLLSKNLASQHEVFTTGLFDFLFRISTRKSQLARFDEVWDTYVDYIARTGRQKVTVPPIRILLRIMTTLQKKGAYDEVHRCWESILAKAEELSKLKHGIMVPARRSILSGPLHRYMLCLSEQEISAESVKRVVADVLKRGFELDSRCWNLYIRILCISGPKNHLLAMETAEEQVLYHFGWYPRQRSTLRYQPNKGAMLSESLWRRIRYGKAIRTIAKPHFPFRLESSLGQGMSPAYVETFRQNTTTWKHLDIDPPYTSLHATIAKAGPGSDPAVETHEVDKAMLQEPVEEENPKEGDSPDVDTGVTAVSAFLHQGSRRRYPEYSTIVYLAGVYLQWRNRLIFDPQGTDMIEDIHRKCPLMVKMILKLPRIDDKLQMSVLRTKR